MKACLSVQTADGWVELGVVQHVSISPDFRETSLRHPILWFRLWRDRRNWTRLARELSKPHSITFRVTAIAKDS